MNALLELIRRWFAPRPAPVPVAVRIPTNHPARRKQP
jgi:hypothetical protein